ncbi:hypothetical protein BV22DRAFT_1047308 [Leucogyrophana mollusca]|uniref:Uncharacterized protein n=1 Tax=Leucogyrophana mollusca TaxID=85980 RepID=A0ACB8BG24_9AGAM|nr:hypothetical protein BV22DRAFT_1047308 [Leucogyrophana mollusca]
MEQARQVSSEKRVYDFAGGTSNEKEQPTDEATCRIPVLGVVLDLPNRSSPIHFNAHLHIYVGQRHSGNAPYSNSSEHIGDLPKRLNRAQPLVINPGTITVSSWLLRMYFKTEGPISNFRPQVEGEGKVDGSELKDRGQRSASYDGWCSL